MQPTNSDTPLRAFITAAALCWALAVAFIYLFRLTIALTTTPGPTLP